MPLQEFGQISLVNVATEFGDASPHSLTEFYSAGTGIPSSGAISLTQFYGLSSEFAFTKTVSSNTQEYSLNTDLTANGWDGSSPVNVSITINSGIYVWSDDTAIAGFTIGTLPTGSIVSIINNGYIIGKGGRGGPTTSINGGDAIKIEYDVSITNNSYIAGGGGGGGAGGLTDGTFTPSAGGGGGTGGGQGGYDTARTTLVGGAGGAIGQSGSNGQFDSSNADATGGGGGRILTGTGGAGQTAYNGTAPGTFAASGLGGGTGGSGGAACWGAVFPKAATGGSGGNGSSVGNVGSGTGPYIAGGGGGGWGASGGAEAAGGAGGSGGKAVNLNGKSVTWLATGTRYGAIS